MTPSIYFLVVSVRYLLLALLPVNIVGNSIVFVIFLKKKATRQFFNLLLLNLATADLLFGIIVLICGLAFRFAGTAVNDFYCKATGGVVYLSCGVSVFTLVAIALERNAAVLKPAIQRARMCDTSRNRRFVQLIWVLTLVFVSPIVMFLKKIDVTEDIVDCGFVERKTNMAELGRIYDAIVVLVMFFVPNCFICCLYGRLVFKLWCNIQLQRKPRLVLMRSRHRVTKVSFIITVVFTVCWSSYYFRTLYTLVSERHLFVLGLVVCRLLVVVNSCANPIIYTLQSARFRSSLRRLLGCHKNKISPQMNRDFTTGK